MNRRRFLSLMTGAGTAAALPPSMVWPFRKIFLPPAPRIVPLQEVIDEARHIIDRDVSLVVGHNQFQVGDMVYLVYNNRQWLPPKPSMPLKITAVDQEERIITFGDR